MKTILDNRCQIRSECCGYSSPRYVVRFCGDWIGQAPDKRDAKAIALKHFRER